MKIALMLFLLPCFAGCSTLQEFTPLENRVTCSLDGKKAWVISTWWTFGISTDLSPRDTKQICKAPQ